MLRLFSLITITFVMMSCAHSMRSLACREACARLSVQAGHKVSGSTGWPIESGMCGCRFDDGVIDYTCERPNLDGSCA